MIKFSKKIKKLFLVLVIFSIISSSLVRPAQAYPSPTSAMNQILGDLGVDKGVLKEYVKDFNASRQKRQQPQVSLHFEPSNPIDGQRITATATPTYFMNESKNLYFTWYLQTKNCGEDDNPSDQKKAKCDLNDDGKIDIEDYKIKAARILASADFDWEKALGKDSPSCAANAPSPKPDYCSDPNSNQYKNSADNHATYEPVWGGDDQRGKNAYCYTHDTQSGNDVQIDCDHHLFPKDYYINDNGDIRQDGETVADNGANFDLQKEQFWHTDPTIKDTAGTGYGDQANVIGLGANNFSWVYQSGDKVGVVIEGVSTQSDDHKPYDSSQKTMWAFLKEGCKLDISLGGYPKTTETIIPPNSEDEGAAILISGNWNMNDTTNPHPGVWPDWDPAPVGKTYYLRGVTLVETSTITHSSGTSATVTTTGQLRYQLAEDNSNDAPIVSTQLKTISSSQAQTSIYTDVFGTDIYGYNYPKTETIQISESNLGSSNIKKVSDMNSCLMDNIVDPVENNDVGEKLQVDLTYSPEFPMNNPVQNSGSNSISDGDILTVHSVVSNAINQGYVHYKWEVFGSDDPNPDSWGAAYTKSQLPEASPTIGMNLDTFKFKLNLANPPKYLKVKLTVTENLSSGTTRESRNSVVVPISSTTQRIRAFEPDIADNLKMSISDYEYCTGNEDKSICHIAKDQILGLRVDVPNDYLTDMLWTLDGKPITYNQCFFDECTQEGKSNVAYIAATGDPGTRYTVNFSGTNQQTGDKINVTRIFEVIDPQINLISADEEICKPVLLGYYVDLDGKKWPDYSKANFIALSGYPLKFAAVLNTGIYSTPIQWYIGNSIIDPESDLSTGYKINDSGNNLTIDKETVVGENYPISASLLYTQNPLTKKALNTYWGVNYTDFYEKQISATINVSVLSSISDSPLDEYSSTKGKVFASVISSLPDYLLFILQLSILTFVFIAGSKVILSLFPALNENDI